MNFLSNKQLVITSDSFNSDINRFGEKELENTIEQMTDEQFIQYIQSLDPAASIEIKEGLKKIRKYNKKVIVDLKEKYQYRCQICGESSVGEYGVSVAEAHHMEQFSLTQNNKPDNIMILCPSHHRIIHKANGLFNKKEKIIEYDNGRIDSLTLNYHL
jgi:predicted restriction endonuclease